MKARSFTPSILIVLALLVGSRGAAAGDLNKLELRGTVISTHYVTGPGGSPPSVVSASFSLYDAAASQPSGAVVLTVRCSPLLFGKCSDPTQMFACPGNQYLLLQTPGPGEGQTSYEWICGALGLQGSCSRVNGVVSIEAGGATSPMATSILPDDNCAPLPLPPPA